MRYARRSGVWHSQTLEKKHVYRVFHHAAVTQHRRELISTQHLPLSVIARPFPTSDLNSIHRGVSVPQEAEPC